VIALEVLKLVNMTKSAEGEAPGKGVAQRKGLNRGLQDAALARLAYWMWVKAEEAGRRVWRVNPKDSSRECIACGHTEAANRCRGRFTCTKCAHRARRRQRGPGHHRSTPGSRDLLACCRVSFGQEARTEEPAAG
jgi:putative transposase